MQRSLLGLLVLTLVTWTGCSQGTSGGPGVTDPPQKQPIYGEADDTFNLVVPVMSTSLNQGETKEVAIGIKRGKNFDEDVTLKFADGPQGVTLGATSPVIKHGDTEAQVTLTASDDAALGDFTIQVTGHPTKGADATIEFKVKVDKK